MTYRETQLHAWQEHLEAVSWKLDGHERRIRELPDCPERRELAALNERSQRLLHRSLAYVERQLCRVHRPWPPPATAD